MSRITTSPPRRNAPARPDRLCARNGAGPNVAMILGHEETILSRLMNREDALPSLSHLTEQFFSAEKHRHMFRAIVAIRASGKRPVPAAVDEELRRAGHFEAVGGNGATTSIFLTPANDAITDYAAGELLDRYRRNLTAQIGEKMMRGEMTPEQAQLDLAAILKPAGADDLTVLTVEEILALPKDEHSCLLGDRLLAKGQSLVIAGPPGLGKSRLVLQLVVACIIGRAWCGFETHARPLRWLVLQTENGAERLKADCAALLKYAGDFDQTALHIQVIQSDQDGFLCLADPATVSRIEATIRHVRPDGIVADPLRDFGIGDLNSDADMIATLRELSRIVRLGNPDRALVLLHHALTGRAGAAKAFGLERTGFARNSKTLLGWARAQINVIPGAEDNNEQLVLTCGKNSNGKEFPPVAVRLNPATMIYEPDTSFDINDWRQELSRAAGSGRTRVNPQILRELLETGRHYDKREIVTAIMAEKGVGKTRAYELIDQAKGRGVLHFNKGTKTYALA